MHSSSKWMDEHNEGFNQETFAFNLDGSNRKADQVNKEYAHPPKYMGTLDEVDWSMGGFENDYKDDPKIIRSLVECYGSTDANIHFLRKRYGTLLVG